MIKHFKKLLGVIIAILIVVSSFSPAVVKADTIYDIPTGDSSTMVKGVSFDGVTYDAYVPSFSWTYAWRVLELVNNERAKAGLPGLVMDYDLCTVATGRAAETTVLFDHTRPNGESCFSCFPSVQGYIGENLAAGYRTPEAVVDGWMNSPGHRANILRKEFRSIGIGLVIADDRYGYYCAQSFGDTVDTVVTYSGTSYGGVDYSSIFNYSYYLTKNPDVKKSCQYSRKDSFSVIKHFLNYGMAEGRATTSSFNVSIYKENYPDLQKAYGNDLKKYYLHYMNYGKKEGRNATSIIKAPTSYGGVNYSAVYDYNYYIKNNPDVKKAFGGDKTATLKHFVNYGMAEGRRAKASFDVKSYRLKYGDLRLSFGKDLKKYYLHYINYGQKEGRIATGVTTLQNPVTKLNGVNYSAVYDYNYYIKMNPDVKRVYGQDDVAVLKHFVNYGMAEGRQAKATFNINVYMKQSDLKKAFGKDKKKYYLHYINFGKKEGRKAY